MCTNINKCNPPLAYYFPLLVQHTEGPGRSLWPFWVTHSYRIKHFLWHGRARGGIAPLGHLLFFHWLRPNERRIVLMNRGCLEKKRPVLSQTPRDIPRMRSVFPTHVHCSLGPSPPVCAHISTPLKHRGFFLEHPHHHHRHYEGHFINV